MVPRITQSGKLEFFVLQLPALLVRFKNDEYLSRLDTYKFGYDSASDYHFGDEGDEEKKMVWGRLN